MKVSRKAALSLFGALGFKTAKRWDAKKMESKIAQLPELVAGTKLTGNMKIGVKKILAELKKGNKVEVIAKEDTKIDKQAKKEVEAAAKRAKVKKEEKRNKDKKDKKKKAKIVSGGKKKEAKKTSKKDNKKTVPKKEKKEKAPRKTIDGETVALLKKKPVTIEQIIAHISKEFPEHAESLLRTMPGRLGKYLEEKYSVKIIQDKKERFFIKFTLF